MTLYNPVLFRDREEAGQKLGQKLKKLKLKKPVVLAIPSGGVPVGFRVAKILKCPLDLIIARKIQFPWTTEAGFGAAVADGTIYLGPDAQGLSQKLINLQTKKALKEVKHRKREFLSGKKEVKVPGRTVILVDDGLATGSTMFAAIRSIKKKKPTKIIVAVPSASAGAVKLLKKEVKKVITLYTHPKGLPFAVASSYKKWHDLTDEEVKKYLAKAYQNGATLWS